MFEQFLQAKRKLPTPGSFDNLHQHTRILPANFMVEGAKCDIASILGPNSQVYHSLAWGGSANPPSYSFGAYHATPLTMLTANIDHNGSLQGRANYNWIPIDPNPQNQDPAEKRQSTSKIQVQISNLPGMTAYVLEHEHHDYDYVLNFKAINPNPIDYPPSWSPRSSLTGIFGASLMQSVSDSWAVGAEFLCQRPTPENLDTSINYAIRYSPPPTELKNPPVIPAGAPSPFPPQKMSDPTRVFAASISPGTGLLHSSYWQRINTRLEVVSELQVLLTPGQKGAPGKRAGVANVGFKLDTIHATIRGMLNSQGLIASHVEQKIAPGLSFTISSEMDYSQGKVSNGKVGFGLSFEA